MNGSLKDSLDFLLDLVHALLSFSKAKRTALSSSSGATSPANWSKSPCSSSALWIADKKFLVFFWLTSEWMSHATVEHLLVASESKIRHALGAFRLAHAASEGVVALLALGVPHESPLLAILTFRV